MASAELASGQQGIEIDLVSKQYGRGADGDPVAALEDVSLAVAPGEFVSILGPSGCGKSTLLRIIAGLLQPSSGEVRIGGKLVREPQTNLGIVFQSPILMDWRTVLGNVLLQAELRGLYAATYRTRAEALLELVGLSEFRDARPYQLSGGMRQRASICRALVHDPPLLLMDEPFGALDALTREQMRLDIERLWLETRKTVVFITHSVDEAVLLSDRVVVLSPRPGRVERVISIDLPRPRGIEGRKRSAFIAATEVITDIFLARGVLHA